MSIRSNHAERLSLPARRTAPRPLHDDELEVLHHAAAVLIPPAPGFPGAAALEDFDTWLQRAIDARAEEFDTLTTALQKLRKVTEEDLFTALRSLEAAEKHCFDILAAVIAGAYLMSPTIMAALGFPGLVRHPVDPVAAVDQITDGILDPVLDRGPIYVEVPAHDDDQPTKLTK
jgi:hypothetical protein